MNSAGRILMIEDDAALAGALQRVLPDDGHHVEWEQRGDRGLARAQAERFDVVLTDLRLPGLDGLDLVRELHQARPKLPVILMTAHGTTATAIESIRLGAYDYVLKPFDMVEFLALVAKAVASSRLMSEPVGLGAIEAGSDNLIGSSRAMQAIYKEVGRVAARPVNVLIQGETGTGKELIARALYQHSERAHAPFVVVNCSALPETLLESELFGHERGAFTGADARRIGRFEQANRGTIFLDEIGEMSLFAQVKLLRVLQERVLERLGGRETIPVDVRVIAATHRDLEAAVRQGRFREDLYYRLNVVLIRLPPLREHAEDIPDLIQYFLRKYGPELGGDSATIQPEAVALLRPQPWPGNVRELENVVRKALLLARGYPINADHVRTALAKSTGVAATHDQSLRDYVRELLQAAQLGEVRDPHLRLLESVERELFSQAIQLVKGNQAKAARLLGVSRLTMQKKLLRFGLHPGQQEPGA